MQKEKFYKLSGKTKFSENVKLHTVESFMLRFFETMNKHMSKAQPLFAQQLMTANTLHLSEMKVNDAMVYALSQFFDDTKIENTFYVKKLIIDEIGLTDK